METLVESPLQFSAQAVKEIRRLMEEPGFDKKQTEDQVFESNGLSFILNPSHSIYLAGMQIHWEDGLNARGFSFNNPNASKTCGCGTSFAV